MSKQYKFSKHLDIIFKEMCKRAGADFDKMDFGKEGWYKQYSWSEKQSDDFGKWFVDYLVEHKAASRELYGYAMPKYRCKEAWSWFNLTYGWKYERQ